MKQFSSAVLAKMSSGCERMLLLVTTKDLLQKRSTNGQNLKCSRFRITLFQFTFNDRNYYMEQNSN